MAKKKDSNRSLTFIIIVMAIICVFVGYLVGVNLFRWMKQSPEPQVAQTENQIEETPKEVTNQPEEIDESEEQKEETTVQEETEAETDSEVNIVEESSTGQYDNLYKIQVGAFSNRENAESFKNELENHGYNVIIEEASTFKVRVIGKSSREETEEIENQLIELGYDTFIVK